VRQELLAGAKKHDAWDPTYSGFGIEAHGSAEKRYVQGGLRRPKKHVSIRGLNRNHNDDLKNRFKSTATVAAVKTGPTGAPSGGLDAFVERLISLS
jgi:hypothetical protein